MYLAIEKAEFFKQDYAKRFNKLPACRRAWLATGTVAGTYASETLALLWSGHAASIRSSLRHQRSIATISWSRMEGTVTFKLPPALSKRAALPATSS